MTLIIWQRIILSSAQVSALVQKQQIMTQLRPMPGFLYQILTFGLGEALQHPRKFFSPGPLTAPAPPPTPQPSPPRLTVAWKNNCTRKTIKTILAEIPQDGLPNLLASSHGLRCGGI